MKALWTKLVAFYMAIVAFFTGLFSAGTTPESSPEPPAQNVEAKYGLPVLAGDSAPAEFQSSGSTVVYRYDHANDETFRTYQALLRERGFAVYDARRIENNRFATLTDNTVAVHLSWFPATETFRVVAERRGELCALTDTFEANCDSLLTGMKGETVVAAEGMGFIIRLADGSFCIIDGGMGDPDHVDSDKLMHILNAQKPEGAEKPVIAAWIFTHLHGDHVGVFNCFSLDHHDDVALEKLIYNFPKEEEIEASDSPYMLDASIYRWTQFKKNLQDFYADVPVLKVHTGNRFQVRNAAFDVLYTLEDLYPQTISNGNGMNESSLLLKMTLEGQTFLWTGDFGYIADDLVVHEYSETLKCDVLQMAHHGWNGTAAFYSAVDPTYAVLPVSFDVQLASMLSSAQNAWLVNSPKMKQLIVTSCGTWTMRLPYAPAEGSFERIPSEETVYPPYPALLGA